MEFVPLIREFGPIIIVYLLVFHAGPKILKDMADVGVNRARIQDHAFETSVTNVTMLLQQNQKERDRNDENEAAMREAIRFLSQELERAVKIVDTLVEQLKAVIAQIQAVTGQVNNIVIHVNDIDQRMGLYVNTTQESLKIISDHIMSKSQEKSE